MRLNEHEGKAFFRSYGIRVPEGSVIDSGVFPDINYPAVIKAQVPLSDRKKQGGVRIVSTKEDATIARGELIGSVLGGVRVEQVLMESFIEHVHERFVSFLYDPLQGGPVLMLGLRGGTGVHDALVFPIDLTQDIPNTFFTGALAQAGFPEKEIEVVTDVLTKAWKLFTEKNALVVEINPLFITTDDKAVAGDAKVELDDAVANPGERTYVELPGDIALLASGGGASMLALDALIKEGGRPANYTEYSGNPPKEVVAELTKRVLGRPGLTGCFVVGAAANFTDIEATLSGFLEGLRTITPKPTYPIVIRRDGPRREEAFIMLKEAGETEGYDFHLYDATTPITESAKTMVELAYTPAP